jgi:threonine aldolase
LELAEVAGIIAPDAGPYLVSTKAVSVENTHNFGGGTIQDLDTLTAVGQLCRDHGVGYHLDGARLWNAHVATGIALDEYGRLFDTVSVAFSRGLGAPVGSMLVGSAERMAQARVWRKGLGGGMRQAGILAAGAAYALDHHLDRLADDHATAYAFAAAVAERVPDAVDPNAVPTNIVVLDTGSVPASTLARRAAEQAVIVSALGPRTVRAVTHLQVTPAEGKEAGVVVGDLLATEAVRVG